MSLKTLGILASFFSLIILVRFLISQPDGNLRFIQCDVGQGDAILITHHIQQILIDTGPNNRVITCLNRFFPFYDKQIDILVLTHLDQDHSGGVVGVLAQYEVKVLVWNGLEPESSVWRNIRKEAEARGVKILSIRDLSSLKINQLQLDILWPLTDLAIMTSPSDTIYNKQQNEGSANNQSSLVSRFSYADFSALLMADMPESEENALVKAHPGILSSTLLKVGHHGSKLSTSERFLTEVKPMIATIGVGKNNYGHPDPEILNRLLTHNIEAYRTDLDHDVVIATDGEKWWKEK